MTRLICPGDGQNGPLVVPVFRIDRAKAPKRTAEEQGENTGGLAATAAPDCQFCAEQ